MSSPAVPTSRKPRLRPSSADARSAAVEAVAGDWPVPVGIRINGVGSEWHSVDIDAVAVAPVGVRAKLPNGESFAPPWSV